MSKSYDLRVQALSYIRAGGSKAEAARLFGVTRRTLYNWLERGDELAQTVKPGPKGSRKVCEEDLIKEMYPVFRAALKAKASRSILCSMQTASVGNYHNASQYR
ncbi:MAG: IS630 transposase-related protein [Alphaproteobacteria bacterium]